MGLEREALQKRVADLEEVIRISSVLADETLGLGFRLQGTIQAILRVIGAQTGSIMLVEKDELVVRAASNQRIVGFRKSLKDSSVSTDVIRTGKKNLMRKSGGAESHPKDGLSQYKTDFSVSYPLFAIGSVVGVLNITDKLNVSDFTADEIDFIENFKRWIEILLENMLLRQKPLGSGAGG